MCFGPPQHPRTPKAATFRTVIQVIMVVQIVIVVLNFIARYVREGIFGLIFIFLLFIIQRRLTYQVIMIFIFISIFFSVDFMVTFLTPLQKETNFAQYNSMDRFIYADAIISFIYYVFCAVFFFYPYREFKSIEYNDNPALRAYFAADNQPSRQNKDTKNEDPNYDINYGDIVYDEKKKNNDNGTFEVFKGQGVKIG